MRASSVIAASICLLLGASALDAEVRQSVIIGVGEQALYNTEESIATVTTPPGTNLPPKEIIKFGAQQYGNQIAIKALRKGEVKLLVESTAAKISEIVTVTVVDPPVAEAHRRATGAMANVDGISADGVFASGAGVLVTGMTYSTADANRCAGIEAPAGPKKAQVACAARLDSAVAAVATDAEYVPSFSATLHEEASKLGGESTPGSESVSTWVAELRLGDVPFGVISSPRGPLVDKCIVISSKLRRAVTEWRREALAGRVYPVVVTSRKTPKGFELAMQWKLDQGTKGEQLAEFTFDELQFAARQSGVTPDRLVDWWAASLQDTFRLYFLAMIPLRAGGSTASPTALAEMYRATIGLDSTPLSRADAAGRLAKGYTALRWSRGADPFAMFATRVPNDFQTTAAQAPAGK